MKKLFKIFLSVGIIIILATMVTENVFANFDLYMGECEYGYSGREYTDMHLTIDATEKGEALDGIQITYVIALYNDKNELVEIKYKQTTAGSMKCCSFMVKTDVLNSCAYARGFVWTADGKFIPLCESKITGINRFSLTASETEVTSEPVTVDINISGEIAESGYAMLNSTTTTPTGLEYLYKSGRVSFKGGTENGGFEVKQNGTYMVYVKDENGLETYKKIDIYNIQGPELELSYEAIDNKAIVTVSVVKSNENAPVSKMAWGEYYTYAGGRYEDYLLGSGIEIINNTFEVTKDGEYAVAAIDEWGNMSYKSIKISGITQTVQ